MYMVPDNQNCWFIADTHFDHTNILKYCDRPFTSVEEMNEKMFSAWNSTIKKDDLVFFLGDMSFGRKSHTSKWWAERLSGKMIFIKGSHDYGVRPTSIMPSNVLSVHNSLRINAKGMDFFLIHESLGTKNCWTIHGHNHNNSPLIDYKNKKICVSVENINYTPISFEKIIKLIGEDKK